MKTKNPCHWVMDIETMANLFAAVFEHYTQDIRHVFVVHELQNDLPALIEFLEANIADSQWHISYNGLAFDSQVIQHLLRHKSFLLNKSGDETARFLYQYAQQVIDKSNRREWSDYPEWKLSIKQIDLFKMNHWDSGAKNSSLKWIQYSTDWLNMEEMPLPHQHVVTLQEEIDMTVNYCINDVRSTKHIFRLSLEQVALRQKLTNTFDINLYNASEPRISKELFSHFLAPKMGVTKWGLKELRTYRPRIDVNDLILPYINFKTKEFIRVEAWFRGMVIENLEAMSKEERKKKYSFSTIYKGCKTDYGLGGIHGVTPGHHKAKPGFIIMTSDVTSFYPNLAIRNKWAPQHIPKDIFCDQYEWFFEERKLIPKKDPINYVYKIILNATYGLSSEENSFLYDPLFTMQITVNGQLSLSMLYESLAERIPDAKPLMQNTDGLEMMIPEQYKDRYMEICKEWEDMTSLQLEHDQYRELIAPDVNNYIAVTTTGSTKEKGRFEWQDLDKKKTAVLHKNKSFLIIPKAIYAYYVDGTLPEIFLKNNRNIFDYCGGAKAKGEWHFEGNFVKDGKHVSKKLNKIIRYYISDQDPEKVKIIKVHNTDGRTSQVEAGKWEQVICNVIDPNKKFEDYKINMSYYLDAIYREINHMDRNVYRDNVRQLEIF